MNITPSFEIGVIELIGKFRSIIKNTKENIYDLFEVGLEEALKNQAEKFYMTNNFIYRENKVPFYDVYFPISVGNKKTYFDNPIHDLEDLNYINIVGIAGSGKSTLSKYIFLNAIKESRKIPLFIELRSLNSSNLSFKNYVISKILNSEIKSSESKIESALKEGLFLIILDGYDEITYERVASFEDQLTDFIDKNKYNNYVITSRPGTSANYLPRFRTMYVNNLTTIEVAKFIKMQLRTDEQIKKMLEVVSSERSRPYLKFLENPLLLSMFIVTFEYFPEIPENKSEFYKNVFDTLYSKHDGINKNSFFRKKRSGLQRIQFEKLLGTISYVTFFKGKFIFEETFFSELLSAIRKIENSFKNFENDDLIYDLITSISILVKDGLLISFPHRSIQEYFAATFIKELDFRKKAKAYDKFLNIVIPNSNDDFENFVHLCIELDKDGAISCLIVKVLKSLIYDLSNTSFIYELCNKLEISVYFQLFDARAKVPFKITEIRPSNNYILQLIKHFNCSECIQLLLERICGKYVTNNLEKILLKHGRKILYDLKITNQSSIRITTFFDNNPDTYSMINDYFKKEERKFYIERPIQLAIKKFESQIANNNLAVDKLLDL